MLEHDTLISDKKVYGEYTQNQLTDAFNTVCDPDDWRNPIDAKISVEAKDITLAAVVFFVGEATVEESEDGMFIYSAGYRMGPAGP